MNRLTRYTFRVVKLLVLLASVTVASSAGSNPINQRQLPQDGGNNKGDNVGNNVGNNNVGNNNKVENNVNKQDNKSPTLAPSISTSPSFTPMTSSPTTPEPTAPKPTAAPTPSPSASPTSSSAPTLAPIPYSRPTRVDIRYVPWADLPDDVINTATLLSYTEETWNDYGSNPIEDLDWDRLDRTEKMYAGILGFSSQSWNCWMNHYQSLRWIDLENDGIQARQWWEDLGWDISSWNKYEDAPSSNDEFWYVLSEEERFAAAQLCYFKRTWDEADVYVDGLYPLAKPEGRYKNWDDLDENMTIIAKDGLKYNDFLWNVVGLNPIEGKDWAQLTPVEAKSANLLGLDQISWDCWVNHFRGYTWEELKFYGIDFYYSALGYNDQSWIGLEEEPKKKSWKELNEAERKAATELCFFRETWEGYDMTKNYGPFPFAKPKIRYVQWDELPDDIQIIANGTLEYTKEKWNNLGSAKVETRGWDDLTEEQQSDAIDIGFYKATWDCFQSHFSTYQWEELSVGQQDIFRLLGWNETSWSYKQTPSSYEKQWDQLSTTEQSAANAICYFEHNWNKNNLEEVTIEFPTTYAPTVAPSKNPANSFSSHIASSIMALAATALACFF